VFIRIDAGRPDRILPTSHKYSLNTVLRFLFVPLCVYVCMYMSEFSGEPVERN